MKVDNLFNQISVLYLFGDREVEIYILVYDLI